MPTQAAMHLIGHLPDGRPVYFADARFDQPGIHIWTGEAHRFVGDPDHDEFADDPAGKIWTCKIGAVPRETLPSGSDAPMRRAAEDAYRALTGSDPAFCFSGWGGQLTPGEREVIDEQTQRIAAAT